METARGEPRRRERIRLKRRIAIIGGGLAGIAAALRIAEAGDIPILIETRKRLGGRATSFTDPRSGETLDNCQHVVMGCCTNLLDFYDRLGVLDSIEWHRTFYWKCGSGNSAQQVDREHVDILKAGMLPAPLHLAGAMRRMRLLSKEDKRAISRAMLKLIRMGAKGRFRWTGRTFSEFLSEHGQTPGSVERFWKPVIVSACNIDINRCDAATAIHVFQDGFLANRWSYSMGLPSVPLVELYDAAVDNINERGGEVLLSTSARGIVYDGKRVAGVVTSDRNIDSSAVIATVPPDRLDKLISEPLRKADARLHSLNRFEFSPILGVHLRYKSPIMERPHITVVEPKHGVQWLFNKGVDANGTQYIHAVISAADDWMELEETAIIERVAEDINDILPQSVGLKPFSARSVKEKHATFAAVAGIEHVRPSVSPGFVGIGGGGVENLYIAGDWTDTGWPATMEGAVRSGYAAAQAVTEQGGLVEDVPPGLLARMLGLR